ncbi:MAG: NADP-binding protein [Nanoarchaeota archaeon]|nr:NADP-binding protein [Nanoarchaeota archaeon]MBU4353042.1 NADP-binding protein [Nanoarchaeota archaeon]
MASKTRVILMGIGEMGGQAARLILEKQNFEIVGAIGHKRGVGEDLSKMINIDKKIGVIVSSDAREVYSSVEADIVLHFAASTIKDTFSQVEGALETRKNVITIAEEASFPWLTEIEVAEKIDSLAKEKGVTFVGTGVNPGFMFDYLPITMTGALKKVNKIRVVRVVDFSRYGPAVWEHIGVGKSPESFKEGLSNGDIVLHVGLEQTVNITAKAMGWIIDDFKESQEGLVSKSKRKAKYGMVDPGTMCGFKQIGTGYANGKDVIIQEITGLILPNIGEDGVTVGTYIMIDGEPNVKVSIEGELAEQGGWATVARAVNSIPQVLKAQPGLLTVDQLPPSPCCP